MQLDINQYLTPHFQLWEFLHNKSLEGVTPVIFNNIRNLAAKLEAIRAQLGGTAIHINSGFRTPEHNVEVGGKKHSQHLLGNAVDIVVEGMSPTQVFTALKGWMGGLGHYPNKPKRPGWVHIDDGPKGRWIG